MEKNFRFYFIIRFFGKDVIVIDRLEYETIEYTEENFKIWLNKSKKYMDENYGKFYYNTIWNVSAGIETCDFKKMYIKDNPYVGILFDNIHTWEDIEGYIPFITSLFNTYLNEIKR